MDQLIEISERPAAEEINMIAGWEQWADAGAISSGLPPYLVERTGARRIGQIKTAQPRVIDLLQLPVQQVVHQLRPR